MPRVVAADALPKARTWAGERPRIFVATITHPG